MMERRKGGRDEGEGEGEEKEKGKKKGRNGEKKVNKS